MPSKLTCPACDKVLRPAKPVPAGKKIKCPHCGEIFTAPGEGDVRIQTSGDQERVSRNPDRGKPAGSKKKPAPKLEMDSPPSGSAKKNPAPKLELDGSPPSSGKKKPAPKMEMDSPDIHEKKKQAPKLESEESDSLSELGGLPGTIPLAPVDDDDDDGGVYSFQDTLEEEEDKKVKINYAPDTSIKDLRGPAQAAVIAPSNMVLRNGIIGFAGWLLFLVLLLIPVLFPLVSDEGTKDNPLPVLKLSEGLGKAGEAKAPDPAPAAGGTGGPNMALSLELPEEKTLFMVAGYDMTAAAAFPWYMLLLVLTPVWLGLIYCAIICFGAVKAQNLESRAWGIVASIMTLIPYAPVGCILILLFILELVNNSFIEDPNFPYYGRLFNIIVGFLTEVGFGVWLLVVLLRQDVIDGFNYVPEYERSILDEEEMEDEDDEDDDDEDDDDYDEDDDDYDEDDDDD